SFLTPPPPRRTSLFPYTTLFRSAAEDAASQDPQLVSSMLVAIQDFVRDSFSGAEQQGLDTVRLGELWLWCEPGPFATLVAVIRRSEEHTSELQSRVDLVCRLLLE